MRFAAVTGPGRTAGSGSASLFTSFIPEMAARGVPYEIEVEPDVRYPVVYIKDAADALFRLATAEKAPRRIYNIASGRIITAEMVAAVKRAHPRGPVHVQARPGDHGRGARLPRLGDRLHRRRGGPGLDAALRGRTQMVNDIIDTVRQG